MQSSQQRTALVTGGARGIGAAIVSELRARGLRVLAPPRAELDLEKTASIDAYFHRAPGLAIDVLVNNAGINSLHPIDELDGLAWQAMLQINLAAPLRLIQAVVPHMQQQKWGRILNVSSILSLVARERRSGYSMTKAALNALTRSAAVEFGPDGVLVNALCPGYVETALTRQNNTPAEIAALAASIPLNRLAQPDELARVAAFLCSEENSYLTGQMVVIDGGFTCK
jgi:NAD(P)-dependent dehydrogenase (short-subunit alcohol dehydrogenase family)